MKTTKSIASWAADFRNSTGDARAAVVRQIDALGLLSAVADELARTDTTPLS